MRGRTIVAVSLGFAIAFSACSKAPTTNQNTGQSNAQSGKPDPNQQDTEGRTALDHAAGNGDLGTVQILLDGGAGVNSRGASGITPLMTASGMGQIDVVKLLLSKGADVNAREGVRGALRARTPLMLATRRGLLDIVNLLLAKGADVNARDEDGRTPLIWAADSESDSSETVKILLIKGANPNARDKDGATALSWAKKRGETPLVILLKKTVATQ